MRGLVLVVCLLSATTSWAGELGVSEQGAWERDWRALRAQFNEGDSNGLRRRDAEQKLLQYVYTLPAGTTLHGWIGTLSTLRIGNVQGVGESVIGQIALADPIAGTPHVVCFAQALSETSPGLREKLKSFEMGSLVQFSGEVLGRAAPPAGKKPTTDESFVSLFAQAFQATFGETPKQGAPMPLERVFPKPGAYGASVYLRLSDIAPVDVRALRASARTRVTGLLAEMDSLAGIRQVLLSDSRTTGVMLGSGMIGRVAASLDCRQFLTMKDFAPCPEFVTRARAIGCECPEALVPGSGPGGYWKPYRFDTEGAAKREALQAALGALDGARLLSDMPSVEPHAAWIAAVGAEMRRALSDYSYLDRCLQQEAGKWVAAGDSTTIPSVAHVTSVEVQPPHGLKWGMSFNEVKAANPKITDLGFNETNNRYNHFPLSFGRALAPWTMAGHKVVVTFGFNSARELQVISCSPEGFSISDREFSDPQLQNVAGGLSDLMRFWESLRSGVVEKYGQPGVDDGQPRQLPRGGAVRVVWPDTQGGEVELAWRCREDLGYGGPPTYDFTLVYKAPAFKTALDREVKKDF